MGTGWLSEATRYKHWHRMVTGASIVRDVRCPDCGKVLMQNVDARGTVMVPCYRCAIEKRDRLKEILLIGRAQVAATTGR